MRFQVLGALDVGDDVVSLAPKVRQLLAALLVHGGGVVPAPLLVEELWDAAPPRTARATLQSYATHLRSALAECGAGRPGASPPALRAARGGYRFDIAAGELDATEFLDAAASGRRVLAAGDPAGAHDHLARALGLWRGPFLLDVELGPALRAEKARMEQVRLRCLRDLLAVRIRMGHHREVLDDLAALVARYPVDESLCALYMTALSRSGQRARAIEAFGSMVDEVERTLDVTPTTRLWDLRRAVEQADPIDVETLTDAD